MLFANDYNDNRVHIDDTCSNQEYYCPCCGAPLITRKGDIKSHHFAHKAKHVCSDSWVHSYDVSDWHAKWQSIFPTDNQEVKLSLGDISHRADVMIDRTVIEFQHSIMSVSAFENRNNFYLNLGYKLVWLFDLSELISSEKLSFYKKENGLVFNWRNPKRAFNSYDIKSGCVDLFFQLSETREKCIVKVNDVSEEGFEVFYTSEEISRDEFLEYVGLKDGKCLPPERDDVEKNKRFYEFKEKYGINLNKQQERALLAVEGCNLLLAVPGSGKTTVLVDRLGHMVFNKGISPEKILAITYNVDATREMKKRFSAKFGNSIGGRISFKTINSMALAIYKQYCDRYGKKQRSMLQSEDRRMLLADIFRKYNGEYATENDVLEFSAAITYIKNMMLEDCLSKLEKECAYPYLEVMYKEYKNSLNEKQQMDFDDQLVYAYEILTKREMIAKEWQSKYSYICVDEAQDTSKIQHEIIKILAHGNNIFMVGDEDQSIYGFRAAYPKALLNFRYDYVNPYILRMERNYRSTEQIVAKAQAFISQNRGRYDKNMTAERGAGDEVEVIRVSSREEQYLRVLEIARNVKCETAFLYRDNETSVVLVDLFLRNNVKFGLRKPELNFFRSRVVKDLSLI